MNIWDMDEHVIMLGVCANSELLARLETSMLMGTALSQGGEWSTNTESRISQILVFDQVWVMRALNSSSKRDQLVCG